MSFSAEVVEQVWKKATYVSAENEKNGFRKDQCGAWIQRNKYGNRNSTYGCEIDHITPVSRGGTDSVSNLRPLQWENNAATSDGRLSCPVKANGNSNVRTQRVGS